MKLRNKKTGEIVEVITGDTFEAGGIQIRSLKRDPQIVRYYPSLAELNEEWEDYEEPEEYWFVTTSGLVNRFEGDDEIFTPGRKQIGNYLGTREEAEKAVEKLKAWKRLKDKGFRVCSHRHTSICGEILKIKIEADFRNNKVFMNDYLKDDLNLLFGGEE